MIEQDIEKAKEIVSNLYSLLQNHKEDVLAIYAEAGVIEQKPTVETFLKLRTENEEAFKKLCLILWPEASIKAMNVASSDGEKWYERLLDAAIINPLNTVTAASGQMLTLPATLVNKIGSSSIDSLETAQETIDYYEEEISKYNTVAIVAGIIDVVLLVILFVVKK